MATDSSIDDDEIYDITNDLVVSIEARAPPDTPAEPTGIVLVPPFTDDERTLQLDQASQQPVLQPARKRPSAKGTRAVVGSIASLPASYVSPTPAAQRVRIRRHRKKMRRHLSRKHLRQARATVDHARRRLWTIIWTIVIMVLIILLSAGGAGGFAVYRFFTQTQAKYERQVLTLRDLLPRDNLKMFDSQGVLIGQLTDDGVHTTVKINQIAKTLQDATIATEDKDFWKNQGVDVLRIIRAAIDDLRSGQVVEGGSTITQQLIKNLIVGNQATLIRKLEEIVLTPQINGHYSGYAGGYTKLSLCL